MKFKFRLPSIPVRARKKGSNQKSSENYSKDWQYSFDRRIALFKKIAEKVFPEENAEVLFQQFETSGLNLFEFLNGKGADYKKIAKTIAEVYEKEYVESVNEPVITQEKILIGQRSRKTYSFLPSGEVVVPYDEFLSHYREEKKEERGEVQRYIYSLFSRCMSLNMTDLFIEPDVSLYLVSYKELGGGRINLEVLDRERGRMVVNALKTMASKDSGVRVNVSSETQSGKIGVKEFGVEIRIEFTPTILGEAVSMRFFRLGGYFNQRLEDLGYEPEVIEIGKKIAKLKQGMVLVSGATGHGKSTFIRSIILEANPSEKVVRAVEDPVESIIKGVTHVQVKEGQISFADAIRSFMRANPDIIFVGEVRDPDTAVALIEASMTGHLTFSTTHANTSIEAISRVVSKAEEKGISSREELLSAVASSLVVSFSQRIVKLTEKGQRETGRTVLPVVEKFIPNREDRNLIERGEFLTLADRLKERNEHLNFKLKKLLEVGWISEETYNAYRIEE